MDASVRPDANEENKSNAMAKKVERMKEAPSTGKSQPLLKRNRW